MSNSAVVRALRRRISFYLNSPVFNKYGRSLRDFIVVTVLTVVTFFTLLFGAVLLIDDGRSIHSSCGTAYCINQLELRMIYSYAVFNLIIFYAFDRTY